MCVWKIWPNIFFFVAPKIASIIACKITSPSEWPFNPEWNGTFNPPRYIGLNDVSDSVIDNTGIAFNQIDAVRVRIFMTSPTVFKYSLNGGFNYETTTHTLNSDLTRQYSLLSGTTDFGINIKFTTISGFVNGDYWEFDCCPEYELKRDEDGAIIPPTEENFLGDFGKILPKNEILDSGFDLAMRFTQLS